MVFDFGVSRKTGQQIWEESISQGGYLWVEIGRGQRKGKGEYRVVHPAGQRKE